VLDRLVGERRSTPAFIRCDNGPEMTANALRDWCRFSGAGSAYIEPGSPWQNPYVESFGGRIRDELLSVELFSCLAEAQVLIEDWRHDYNRHRPHAALGMMTPVTCVAGLGPDRGEEAFQATLPAALRHYDDLSETRAVGGWLFSIAQRKVVDSARSLARAPIVTDQLGEHSSRVAGPPPCPGPVVACCCASAQAAPRRWRLDVSFVGVGHGRDRSSRLATGERRGPAQRP
jgi:hypothetical protein